MRLVRIELLLFNCQVMYDSCDPMDCSPPDSSVHGVSRARILEWVAICFSRGSSWRKHQTCISCTDRQILYHWATWEALSVLLIDHSHIAHHIGFILLFTPENHLTKGSHLLLKRHQDRSENLFLIMKLLTRWPSTFYLLSLYLSLLICEMESLNRTSKACVSFIDRGFGNHFFDNQVQSLFSVLSGCGIIQAKSWVSVTILRPLRSLWEQKSRPEGTNSNGWCYLADTELSEKVGGKDPDDLKSPSSS